MSLHVKFFASMRDLIGEDCEISAEILEGQSIHNVEDVWVHCAKGKERPANMLIAVNMDYVDDQTLVRNGDEVAFFPPVTGG
ncbi:MAG: MoaD/ThiS family protein [Gammaproteobacteria bacterium]|nr:MoaD/ThiS family protein [Gammaproteobacteria bacterium]